MWISGLVMVLVAVVSIVTVELAAWGRLGVNGLLGFRFGSVVSSAEAWRAGHRAARIPMMAGSVVLFAAGLLVLFLPLTEDEAAVLVLSGVGVLVLVTAIGAYLANRAARKVSTPFVK